MGITRSISFIFSCTLFIIAACTGTKGKTVSSYINQDTAYSILTKQLKNNKIPDSVFSMTKLRHLAITGMDCDYGDRTNCRVINEIPAAIGNLKDLTTLRLTLNEITSIPPALSELKHLTLLDLTDNAGLKDFDNLSKCQSLQYLYLYGCELSRLPGNIGNLINLKELGLVGNNLDKAEQSRIRKALPGCIIKF